MYKSDFRERIVLVADDEPDICELIEEALEDARVTVWTASTAEEAVKKAASFVVDIFFVDIFMPGKGGLWLIDKCRELHPEAEIIAMSGGFDSMSAEKTMRAVEKLNVRRRLKKPFLIDDVAAQVEEIINAPAEPVLTPSRSALTA